MNFQGGLRFLRRLISADRKSWEYLPYEIGMACRGIDLHGGSNPQDNGLSPERANGHRDSGGPDLHKLLATLPISSRDAVVDMGCGKGGAMITLARYPFARVDGIELSPQLAQVAHMNIERLGIRNATVFCGDAAMFQDLDIYTHVYMYHPFPANIMSSVLVNLTASVHRQKRRITVIYKNPLFHDLVVGAGFDLIRETRQDHPHYAPFRVYNLDPPSPN